MRIGILCVLNIVLFCCGVFSNDMREHKKGPPPKAVAAAAAHAPKKKVKKVVLKKKVAENPYAQNATDKYHKRIAQRRACDSIYANEIREKTEEQKKDLMNLIEEERQTRKSICKNDVKLQQMRENNKKYLGKNEQSSVYKNGYIKKSCKNEKDRRLEAMKEMRNEENKIENNPELIMLRQKIKKVRKKINDIITEIVQDDVKCLNCYGVLEK